MREKDIRILLVDDHDLVLQGLKRIVECSLPEIKVVCTASTGQEALLLIASQSFDLFLLDMELPDMSGLDIITHIRKKAPKARIIVNTMHEEIWMVNRLAQCGVNAVILKASAPAELVAAIRSVLRGEPYTCPRFASISQKLSSGLADWQPKDAPTRRERDVLEAVAKGMNTHEIAALLKISENTVETFRKRLISKFGAKNAIDMVVKAVAQGWIKLD